MYLKLIPSFGVLLANKLGLVEIPLNFAQIFQHGSADHPLQRARIQNQAGFSDV
jgi:hypothetical protein